MYMYIERSSSSFFPPRNNRAPGQPYLESTASPGWLPCQKYGPLEDSTKKPNWNENLWVSGQSYVFNLFPTGIFQPCLNCAGRKSCYSLIYFNCELHIKHISLTSILDMHKMNELTNTTRCCFILTFCKMTKLFLIADFFCY